MTNVNGDALRAIRTKDGQTQKQLAERVGISFQYLNNLENGRRGARPDVVKRLAEALNVPVSAIERRSAA